MPITKSISSLSNVKQLTGADLPQNPATLVSYTYGPATSTANQTVINLGFAVPMSNTANFLLFIDGKLMSIGSSNDFTFTSIQSNGTSSQVTMNNTLAAGLNINAAFFGVVIPAAASTSILTVNATIALQPTVSIATLTSHSGGFSANASGTYTPPTGTKYIKVRMVGGGGGGGGSGSSGGGTGGNGGNTSLGTSLLTAGGGAGGAYNNNLTGGVGGSIVSAASPAVIFMQQVGGTGSCGMSGTTATAQSAGGMGGISPFFGGYGYPTGGGNTGGSPVANTGGGGAGCGTGAANGLFPGSGGGSGAFIEANIPLPSGSYAFSIGTAGGGGSNGATGGAGGPGAGGQIIIEEHYV